MHPYDGEFLFSARPTPEHRSRPNGRTGSEFSRTASDQADAFRLAMRQVATSVAIVTTVDDGVDYGMTATAFASVSMAPPTLLIIVNEMAAIYRPLSESGRFCLNILDEGQEHVARRFAAQPSDQSRFQIGEWVRDCSQPARLLCARGWINCIVEIAIPAGTHSIFLGTVTGAHSRDAGAPLLYLDGRYACVRD